MISEPVTLFWHTKHFAMHLLTVIYYLCNFLSCVNEDDRKPFSNGCTKSICVMRCLQLLENFAVTDIRNCANIPTIDYIVPPVFERG